MQDGAMDHPARFVARHCRSLASNGDPMSGLPSPGAEVWLYLHDRRAIDPQAETPSVAGLQRPDHNTLWRFYKNHRQAMSLFKHDRMELVDGSPGCGQGEGQCAAVPMTRRRAACWNGPSRRGRGGRSSGESAAGAGQEGVAGAMSAVNINLHSGW